MNTHGKCPPFYSGHRIYLMPFLLFFFSPGLFAHPVNSNFKIPSAFIENKNQFIDQSGQPCSKILFVYKAQDFSILLRETGFSYVLSRSSLINNEGSESGYLDEDDADEKLYNTSTTVNRIDVDFVKPGKGITILKEGPSSYYFNYYNVPQPVLHVLAYQKVTYLNVYKGIDFEFLIREDSTGQRVPEYRWRVHLNGNLDDIGLAYKGSKNISPESNGDMIIKKDIGYVTESHPLFVSITGRQQRDVAFKQIDNVIRLEVTKPILKDEYIIDPTISFGFYFGGVDLERPDDLVLDKMGSAYLVYVCGRTKSDPLDNTFGAGFDRTYNNGSGSCMDPAGPDAFAAQFNSNGALLWATYIGGSGGDIAFTMCTDPTSDNVFIAGRTYSCDYMDFMAPPGYQVNHGSSDGFITCLSSNGACIRSIVAGGPAGDYFRGIACDAGGNVYVSGHTNSAGLGLGDVWDTDYSGGGDDDIILMKFQNDLQLLLWATYCGKDKGQERGTNITIDNINGFLYQTGTVNKNAWKLFHDPASSVYQKCQYAKTNDAVLIKWTLDGNLEWFTYYGGEGTERGRAVKTDALGNIYILGHVSSKCNPPCHTVTTCDSNVTFSAFTPGAIKTSMDSTDEKDCYIAKFNPDGSRIWATYFGGNKIEEARSLQVPQSGAPIIIGGFTKSTNLISSLSAWDLPTPYQATRSGDSDYFFAILNFWGTAPLYCSYYGGNSYEGEKSTEISDWYQGTLDVNFSKGDIYFTSLTQSTTGITNSPPSGYEYINKGNNQSQEDAFLAKFTMTCSELNDPYEPNNNMSCADAVSINMNDVSAYGKIYPSGDVDYYKVISPSYGGSIQLSELTQDYDLSLYTSNCELYKTSHKNGTSTEKIGFGTPNTTYYIKVFGHSGIESDNASCYRLNFTGGPKLADDFSSPELDIKLYPVPAGNYLEMEFPMMTLGLLTIFDAQGRKVLDVPNISGTRFTLDVSGFTIGFYLARVSSPEDNVNLTQAFSIE